jgi:hypothetical protein
MWVDWARRAVTNEAEELKEFARARIKMGLANLVYNTGEREPGEH